MDIPTIGEIRNFYCECIAKSRSELERNSYGLVKEHNVSMPTPSSTSWVCKCTKYKTFHQRTGFFSSEWITTWMYFWECMNCKKKTDIGVWDSKGLNYGDGKHL